MFSNRLPFALVAIAAVAVSACGNAKKPKQAGPAYEHGVFVSSSDCAASGKANIDDCGAAIDRAVASYQTSAPKYPTLLRCEAAEGSERCDKFGADEYRPRLQAFFVTFSKPIKALPLYPPATAMAGFKSPSKQELSVLNETLKMSRAATELAYENSHLPGKASKARLGADASSVQ